MRVVVALLLCLFAAVPVRAQDDKGVLINYLQDALSGRGRDVQIDGFRGILSSSASLDRLTIADDQGVWLTIENAQLEWSRAALLNGRVEIQKLTAERIDLPRVGRSESQSSVEATPFALPDLPVSIDVGQIAADRVTLGADVMGLAAALRLDGALSLAGGAGQADLHIARLDGPRGQFDLSASYANDTELLDVALSLDEAEGGLAATLLSLPGAPALQLEVKGTGLIDDYSAEIALRSDGGDRLAGQVSTKIGTDDRGERQRAVTADLAGDLTQLFLPEYRDIFGPDTRLSLAMTTGAETGTQLDRLALQTQRLDIRGSGALDAQGQPLEFALKLDLSNAGGEPVVLPISGPKTQVRGARIDARFDALQGPDWQVTAHMAGLARDGLSVTQADVVLNGIIAGLGVDFDVDATVKGIALDDPALTRAIGTDIALSAKVERAADGPVRVSRLVASGAGLQLNGELDVAGLADALTVSGQLAVNADDLSRFGPLAGLAGLGGQAQLELNGEGAVLGGAFDGVLKARAQGLTTGTAALDQLTAGASTVMIDARRDSDGVVLRAFELTSEQVQATASGTVATGQSSIDFAARLADAGVFVPDWRGMVSLQGTAIGMADGWVVDVNAAGPDGAKVTAQVDWPDAESPSVVFDGRIATVRSFVPDLDGPATLTGSVAMADDGVGLYVEADGPASTSVTADGFVAYAGRLGDLALIGALPLGLVNRQLRPNSLQGLAKFDLTVDGPLAAESVSGTVRVDDARLSLPALTNALENLSGSVSLTRGSGQVQVSANVASGGAVRAGGSLSLNAPMPVALDVTLDQIVARDAKLYETTVNGPLRLEGPLLAGPVLSGALTLDRTEIRIPSATIFGAELMEGVTHTGETAAMRATRQAAGLVVEAGPEGTSAASIGLDIRIDASNRIFIRGRGLDAEMGGAIRLAGDTSQIVPDGEFSLIRGRLDILGKRLELEEGSAQLRGALLPTIRLVARTSTDDMVIRVIVEGPADTPDIRFTSEPSLPDDEILAQLLFGRGITSLSALQAVQLGSAISTLAGRGGDGIVEKLRKSAGIDNLDVNTDASGNATVRAGKYISENVYSDVTVDSKGGSSVSINLDLSPSTKLSGRVNSDGETAVGVYFEKDY